MKVTVVAWYIGFHASPRLTRNRSRERDNDSTPARLPGTALTFRHDFHFPVRLHPTRFSLVCYSTVPTDVYLKIKFHLDQILRAIGYGGDVNSQIVLR